MAISRRQFFRSTAAATAAAAFTSARSKRVPAAQAAPATTPTNPAGKQPPTIVDFSSGVPRPEAIKAAGHIGAIRYVSRRRPETNDWMRAKPVTLVETTKARAAGLELASVYQYGAAKTADWLQGKAGALIHAPQAVAIHTAADGPKGATIFATIDDNPTHAQYLQQIRPYLTEFGRILQESGLNLGVYCNYNTIEWVQADQLATKFWQHDWGSAGKVHPAACLHQIGGKQEQIEGIQVDVNEVLAPDWGQWSKAPAPSPAPSPAPAPSREPAPAPGPKPKPHPGSTYTPAPKLPPNARPDTSLAPAPAPLPGADGNDSL